MIGGRCNVASLNRPWPGKMLQHFDAGGRRHESNVLADANRYTCSTREMSDFDAVVDRIADLVAERVVARLANGNGNGHSVHGNGHLVEEDKLLTAAEAAQRLGVTQRWVYAHGARLPFRVQLPGGRAVRFSSAGLARWVEKRQGR